MGRGSVTRDRGAWTRLFASQRSAPPIKMIFSILLAVRESPPRVVARSPRGTSVSTQKRSSRYIALVALVLALPLACGKAQDATPAPKEAASAQTASSAAARAEKPNAARALALQKSPGDSNLDREIGALQRGVEKFPDKLEAWVMLGRAWVRKARVAADPGFYLNAGACADVVLEREPQNRLARNLRALVLLENHAFAEARDLAEQILAEDADDISALGTKSDAELELGDFDAAEKSAQRMVDLKPNLPSYARAAHLRWLHGDSAAAKKIYRSAIDARDPRDPEPYVWVLVQAALIFWHEGDVEGADKGFDMALSALPEDAAALAGKARVALAKGDTKRAVELAERSYGKSPLCETAWLVVDANKADGNDKGALAAEERVKKQGRASDKRTLAAYYAAKNLEVDEAVRLAQEELKVRKGIHTRDALAWALYRKGDLEGARREIEAARALGTKEPTLLYHEGAIRIALAEKDKNEAAKKEGQKLVREALKLNPHFDPTGAAEAKKLIGDAK